MLSIENCSIIYSSGRIYLYKILDISYDIQSRKVVIDYEDGKSFVLTNITRDEFDGLLQKQIECNKIRTKLNKIG